MNRLFASLSIKDKAPGIKPSTRNSLELWEMMKDVFVVSPVKQKSLNDPVEADKVRVVCISDTHSVIHKMSIPIPPGDILIHAGDFTRYGSDSEIKEFNKYLKTLPHKYKIVIAGNHETNLDTNLIRSYCKECSGLCTNTEHKIYNACNDSIKLLSEATYLKDSAVKISGIKIYGTPWQPVHLPGAFTLSPGKQCLEKWNMIPENTDILVSHSPPFGHGDLCRIGAHGGCFDLLDTVQNRVHPKYHIFGHIHEGHGVTTDTNTIFINCSICTVAYLPRNPPIIFDYPLPTGVVKS